MDHADALPVGHILDGHYRVEGVSRRTGSSIIYQATDTALESQYAVKELFPQNLVRRDGTRMVAVNSGDSVAAIDVWRRAHLSEANVLTKLTMRDDRSTSRVLSFFEENGTFYLVTDYINGPPLDQWLSAIGRKPSQIGLDYIAGHVLQTLQEVHGQGVLHLNLSPHSIILRDSVKPVIVDFEVAVQGDAVGGSVKPNSVMRRLLRLSASTAELTAAEQFQYPAVQASIIFPGYSPLEMYCEGIPAPTNDVYALAAILYRCVAGDAPIDAARRKVTGELIPDAGELIPATAYSGHGFRPSFLTAIDWGLWLEPWRRPQSIDEWRRDLLSA